MTEANDEADRGSSGEGPSPWRTKGPAIVMAVVLVLAGGVYFRLAHPRGVAESQAVAALPSTENRWVNGAPLAASDVRGKVWLVEAWHPA